MSETKLNDGGAAFPGGIQPPDAEAAFPTQPGMSLRAYFAGQAMQSYMAAALSGDGSRALKAAGELMGEKDIAVVVARGAVEQADALIAELNK